ncbi:MAG: C69 family dipeptidase [Bacteroidales bacterium]|nr:C69 family dipeptidase [Bacteroidales bacterium]
MEKKLICKAIVLVFCIVSHNAKGQNDFNCFTILAGKNATADGSVLMAHNEDNHGETFADWHKVPRIKHKPGTFHYFLSGDSIEEAEETNGYLWITVSQYNAEQYLNEWGVAITTDASRSNVTDEEGRIGQSLRRIMAERSHSAQEAVIIAGRLIETFGYSMSGRIYSIADPNEAWVLEVTQGKHWVAARVPDDAIVLVPNYYVIDSVNLNDTLNYLSSPDIISYAAEKGWYDPASGNAFNFRKTYCRADRLNSMINIARKWAALNLLSEKQYGIYDEFPFSFKPKHKVTLKELMTIMQNHYEGTEFEMNPAYNNGNPHQNTTVMRICSGHNTFGTILQLRNRLPVDIGCVLWVAPRHPCIQPYIPWYYGITDIPTGYENEDYNTALQNYLNKSRNMRETFPDAGWWAFWDFAEKTDKEYGKKIKSLKKKKEKFESDIFDDLEKKEKEITLIYEHDTVKARAMLTGLTGFYAGKALRNTRK